MKHLGIIGRPLSHSFSPKYFAEKFEKESISGYQYSKYELPTIEDFSKILKPELVGLNVTIPYKQKVMPYLDEIQDEARAIGAVNVIKIENRDGKPYLIGYNSDMYGFLNSFQPHLKPHHTKALVFGTGGASKAVVYALNLVGIEAQYVSRKASETSLSYDQVNAEVIAAHTVLINCTPLGTYPEIDSCIDLPYEELTAQHYCYDLVYNPAETEFMKRAAAQGATVVNGYEMLLQQAEKAWEIWTS